MDQRTYPEPLQENLLVLWQFSSLALPTLMLFPNNRGTYLFCFILVVSWGCLISPTFFFVCNEPIRLAHHKKKELKLWRLSKIEDYMEIMVPPPLAHLYRWKVEDFVGKTYGIKMRCYWEQPWGTHWEPHGNLNGNMLGTKAKWKKSSPPPPAPSPNLKRKENNALWVHAEPSHWLHEISISKTVCHHFWPGLIAHSPIINQGYLPFTIKKYLKAKEELWKFKYFTMQNIIFKKIL
jgi:hypothetical protein